MNDKLLLYTKWFVVWLVVIALPVLRGSFLMN